MASSVNQSNGPLDSHYKPQGTVPDISEILNNVHQPFILVYCTTSVFLLEEHPASKDAESLEKVQSTVEKQIANSHRARMGPC